MIQLADGIQLYSGAMFSYTDPGASDVQIDDIAHALSHVCRFAGHVKHFYSVAQHAVNTSRIVDREFALTALLHDTAEAFTNDLPTPLKAAVPVFKELEVAIETAMAARFGFQFPLPDPVKLADLQMLKLERDELKPHAFGAAWSVLEGVDVSGLDLLVDLSPISPPRAKRLFLDRYMELTNG